MRNLLSTIRRFLSELRHRNVYQVAVAYLVAGFVVVELADIAAGTFDLPGWFGPMVWVLVGLGFPIALVMAWALEMTPEGVRVEEPEGSEEVTTASSPRDLWVGASVLALVLLGAWWLWGGLGGGDGADPAESRRSEIEERSIAVLPFEVSGAGAEEWRDGMVTMLSMNLDGAAGLRAIPDRTVFAAWEKRSSTGEAASTQEALGVARSVGAEYAIVGSAVQLGEELRLGAEVRRVGSREALGEVEVQSSPDRITVLTDQLTRKVLGVLLERSEEQVPSVDLASLTTSSLKALKAYLQGERHFRAGEYEAALEDFTAATRRDSTFALAYWRTASSHAMVVGTAPEKAQQYVQKAYEWSDQLPRRERRFVRAWYLGNYQGRVVAAADTLRRLSERYSDDPAVWNALGEVLWHARIPRGLPEADQAFQRTLDLDPGVAANHLHAIDLAFSLHRDSALVARRIAEAPETVEKTQFRLAKELVFGGPARRRKALSRLDTVSFRAEKLPLWPIAVSLLHPMDGTLQEEVLRRIEKRSDIEGHPHARLLVVNSFEQGRPDKALAQMKELNLTPSSRSPSGRSLSCVLAGEISMGTPIPESTLRAYLEPSRIGKGPSISRLRCSGIYLLSEGDSEKLPALIQRIREAGARQDVPGARIQAVVDELNGYRALQDGDLRRAERLLGGHNESSRWGAIWRGDLYRKLGELKKAEGWYLAAWWHPLTHERLGRLYEKMGKPEKARAAYERFVAAWKNADPALHGRVDKVRRRLAQLEETTGGVPATESKSNP